MGHEETSIVRAVRVARLQPITVFYESCERTLRPVQLYALVGGGREVALAYLGSAEYVVAHADDLLGRSVSEARRILRDQWARVR